MLNGAARSDAMKKKSKKRTDVKNKRSKSMELRREKEIS
jgi:hypothetical protein